MEKFNILNNWKQEFYNVTSPLAIRKHKYIKRKQIDFIYETFLDFFGEKYFLLEKIKYTREQKLVLTRNSFYQLLIRTSDNSFNSLLDVACLLAFSKKLNNGIHKKLLSMRKDFLGLRNYLFEIFVFRLFIKNKVTITLKPEIDGKELEGAAIFKGLPVIIECKKLYSTEIIRFKHLQDNFNLFFKKWINFQPNIFAFIIAPDKNEKVLASEKEMLKKWLTEYYEILKTKRTEDFVFEKFNLNGKKVLHIEKNKPGLFENLRNTIKDPYAFFSAYPPPNFNPSGYNYFRFVNGYYFSFAEADIQEKILNEIKKKRKQHRKSGAAYRILFFENESANFGEFPLVTERILNSNIISEYLNSKESDDVVCIIDKSFIPNQVSRIKMHVYCKPELTDLKIELERFDFKLFHY